MQKLNSARVLKEPRCSRLTKYDDRHSISAPRASLLRSHHYLILPSLTDVFFCYLKYFISDISID